VVNSASCIHSPDRHPQGNISVMSRVTGGCKRSTVANHSVVIWDSNLCFTLAFLKRGLPEGANIHRGNEHDFITIEEASSDSLMQSYK
jgi:hypothetical protein